MRGVVRRVLSAGHVFVLLIFSFFDGKGMGSALGLFALFGQ